MATSTSFLPRLCLGALLLLSAFVPSVARGTNLGANLLANPGAEAGAASPDGYAVVAIPGWTVTGTPTVVSWSLGGGFPILTDSGPAVRGAQFFTGGPSDASNELRQVLDVSDIAARIDGGTLPYKLQGWLGGYASQDDNSQLQAVFRNGALTTLGTATIGPVLAADRNSLTGLLYRQAVGVVPIGTRSVVVSLIATRAAGSYNDGYADSLAFVIGAGVAGADDAGLSGGLWLAPVTPNPGRGRMHFRFALPQPAAAQLDVFDVAGRRVATLASGTFDAGAHDLDWDGDAATRGAADAGRRASAAAGVYFARLTTEGHVLYRRLVRLH